MADSRIVQIGAPAPDFNLPSVAGPTVQLSSFQGKQNVAMFFMREFR